MQLSFLACLLAVSVTEASLVLGTTPITAAELSDLCTQQAGDPIFKVIPASSGFSFLSGYESNSTEGVVAVESSVGT
jgi:hypothetical protein